MAVTRTPRKTVAKATTARKATRTRAVRAARTPVKMPKAVREGGASALGMFEQELVEQDNIGLIGTTMRELKSGALQKVVRFEIGEERHRAVLVVRYR
jgi:hypothetical protein